MNKEKAVLQALAIGALKKGSISRMQTAAQITKRMNEAGLYYEVDEVRIMLRYLITNRLVRFYDNNNMRNYGLTRNGVQYYADNQQLESPHVS